MRLATIRHRGTVDGYAAVLASTLNGETHSLHVPVERRQGRTARWPVSLLPVRQGGRVRGLWLRVGDRVAWFVVWRSHEVYRYVRRLPA